jgi:hypothetical protein
VIWGAVHGIQDEKLEKLMQKRKKKLVAPLLFQILKMLEITFPWIQITIFNNSSSKNS